MVPCVFKSLFLLLLRCGAYFNSGYWYCNCATGQDQQPTADAAGGVARAFGGWSRSPLLYRPAVQGGPAHLPYPMQPQCTRQKNAKFGSSGETQRGLQ